MLIVENVSRSFRIAGIRKAILDSVNLHVRPGEIVSLTGKSGCGKSTLLNIISGLVRPERGGVSVDGKRMNYWFDFLSARARNRHMGFVFQTFRLLSDETVWQNILLPLRIQGWISKKDRDYARTLLKDLEIEDHAKMKAGLLSGGQKQRVALARALVTRPGLILADEPTANLDKATAVEIYQLLGKLKDEGKAILVVTHQDYMFEHSDRVVVLENGKLREGL
jgi:ABC-type lipoprotein export system ATPase subunit